MKNWLERLASLPATSISDAMDGSNNMEVGIKPLSPEQRLVGKAFTVQLRAADNLLIQKAIKDAEVGDVLVIDVKGHAQHAVCGDFVVGMAQTMGLAGMVIDGVVRDSMGIKQLNFPIFCKGTTLAASGKGGAGALQVPISCGGATVHPGDVIVADADGVVVIPKDQVGTITLKAEQKVQKDEERERAVLKSPESVRAFIQKQLGT
ncbi:RraA family protein [Ammoniphilus sp. YIM 78166]|uniref:RraA family protein n=1 Tax=Ammoniphilus sp. YIM 78166 TaxID=1644106 RepID=UPI0010706690|nr:RraA family protein [Ammoniphilus sp. YIM 78166]